MYQPLALSHPNTDTSLLSSSCLIPLQVPAGIALHIPSLNLQASLPAPFRDGVDVTEVTVTGEEASRGAGRGDGHFPIYPQPACLCSCLSCEGPVRHRPRCPDEITVFRAFMVSRTCYIMQFKHSLAQGSRLKEILDEAGA